MNGLIKTFIILNNKISYLFISLKKVCRYSHGKYIFVNLKRALVYKCQYLLNVKK